MPCWRRIVLSALCFFLAALTIGCKPAGQPQVAKPAPVDVKLAAVEVRSTERSIELTGTLHGEEEIVISAKVPGRVVSVAADLGDAVEHGGLLAQIDPTDFRLEIDEAEASLRASLAKLGLAELPTGEVSLDDLPVVARASAQASNASSRLERARKLYDRTPPLLSEQDFADIQTQSEVARAEVASERLNAQAALADARVRSSALALAIQRLSDTRVIAPVEKPLRYRVAQRQVSIGEIVSEGQAMFRLVSSERVKCRASVPERFARSVRAGAEAWLTVDGLPTPQRATVARVAPAVDVSTRTFEIEIEADNASGDLKPGSFCRVRVMTGVDPAARFVPETAVVQFAGVYRVFSVRDGQAIEHRVKPGEAREGWIEVPDLPEAVASVVATPPRGMTAGTPVRADEPRAISDSNK